MRDTLKIECLIQALDEYMTRSREETEALRRYDGPSPGYACAHYTEAKERAAEIVQKRLDEYIDERIHAALKSYASPPA